jgi:hypothetical protein
MNFVANILHTGVEKPDFDGRCRKYWAPQNI